LGRRKEEVIKIVVTTGKGWGFDAVVVVVVASSEASGFGWMRK